MYIIIIFIIIILTQLMTQTIFQSKLIDESLLWTFHGSQ